MTEPAIQVDRLGKLYRLERAGAGSRTFRDLLTDMVHAPMRRLRRLRGSDASMEDFWALKDVSFDIQPGEVVGIIGRNGAGKSTLLKVLSRIVEPTRGQVTMRGRVASLLEVGTGFHPELSGRENIYLNGSILGMKKSEIDARFDEIVAFAEIEKFLDTPVKRYSSGMYVRLAFAVAAHLDPEILIVDEVLAVGDAEFQNRCLGKMKEISSSRDRTVLFVSHNMSAIRSLCDRAVVLNQGMVEFDGPSEKGVDIYMTPKARYRNEATRFNRPAGASMWMNEVGLIAHGVETTSVMMGADLTIEVRFSAESGVRHPRFGFVIQTAAGDKILNANHRYQPAAAYDIAQTEGTIICKLGRPPFMPGRYIVSLYLGDLGPQDHHVEMEGLGFEVLEKDLWGLGRTPPHVSLMWWPASFSLRPSHSHEQANEVMGRMGMPVRSIP